MMIIRNLCPCCIGIALAVDQETWEKIDEMQKGEAPPEAGGYFQFNGLIPGLATDDGDTVHFQATVLPNHKAWEIAKGIKVDGKPE